MYVWKEQGVGLRTRQQIRQGEEEEQSHHDLREARVRTKDGDDTHLDAECHDRRTVESQAQRECVDGGMNGHHELEERSEWGKHLHQQVPQDADCAEKNKLE